MFKIYEDGNIWFSPHCFEDPIMFFLIGVICGLAIYNFTIINLPFTLPLYKKLLSTSHNGIPTPIKMQLEDLEELSPTVAKNLGEILTYQTQEELDALCLNFTVNQLVFGESMTVELKPGGSNIELDLENRQEYVDLYINYVLNESVKTQYEAFHNGFHKVCGGRVLDLFHAKELMALVVGNQNYDWEELQKDTIYKNGYDLNHPTIKNFWSVFLEMSEEDKKKFLLYSTGSDRIPILGMKSLKLIIQKTNNDKYLPVGHTCFNLLDLPNYSTRDILKRKLYQAIQCTEGFGIV